MAGMTGMLQPNRFTLSVLLRVGLTDLTACSRGESGTGLWLRSALPMARAVLDEGPAERGSIGVPLLPVS